MADIYDTLHPVNTPADNLYPNIKPEQNIPDASISKQKLNFSIGGQGAAAILPGEEYVDIAYNGNPGSVLFPKGTYFIYTRDGWLNNTPPYTGTYNTVSEDFDVMAYWYDVSENLIKSSEADPSDDGIILSIPEDDFLVMVLIKNPNENGPRVIPVYSIIPTSLLKYDTRDYDWAALQVTGFTINDGEYPQLGSGYLVDQFITPVVAANTNYYKICNMKILSADIGREIASASAIVWIAATTGSTINTAFVSLNLVMDTLTQDYSASGATIVGGAFDAGKLVYTIEFDADKSELTITLYAALSKDAMLAAGNVCYVRYRDAQGDRQSMVPFFYGTDTGSSAAPEGSEDVHTFGADKDGDGNQISTTYAKQTGSYPSLMAGGVQAELLANSSSLNNCIPDEIGMWKMWYVPTDGNAQTISDKPTEVTTAFKVEAIKIHEVTGGVRVIQRLNDMRSNEFARSGTENGSGGTTFQAWKEKVTSDGNYPNLGAGYLAKQININQSTTSDIKVGWVQVAEIDTSKFYNQGNYSCIMLVNGIYNTQGQNNAGESGLIEIDCRVTNSSVSAFGISILSGNVNADEWAIINDDNNVIKVYVNLVANYQRFLLSVISEGYQTQLNVNFIELTNLYYGITAPANAVYAVNRNNADYDGDGNVISKTYAPIASPEFTGTPTAPTPPAGDNSTRIATTGWVQSTSGAKTAYHHHIQAELRSAQPEPTAHYNTMASAYFEIVTDSADPITSSADLYDALMGLAWTTTETRWTPATGGLWVDEIPDDPDMYPSAWPVVGIRALAQARPDDPGIDSRSIAVMVYRVGKTRPEGPLQEVPFYYSGFASRPSYIYDTVTDQYGTYIAGGD